MPNLTLSHNASETITVVVLGPMSSGERFLAIRVGGTTSIYLAGCDRECLAQAEILIAQLQDAAAALDVELTKAGK